MAAIWRKRHGGHQAPIMYNTRWQATIYRQINPVKIHICCNPMKNEDGRHKGFSAVRLVMSLSELSAVTYAGDGRGSDPTLLQLTQLHAVFQMSRVFSSSSSGKFILICFWQICKTLWLMVATRSVFLHRSNNKEKDVLWSEAIRIRHRNIHRTKGKQNIELTYKKHFNKQVGSLTIGRSDIINQVTWHNVTTWQSSNGKLGSIDLSNWLETSICSSGKSNIGKIHQWGKPVQN